MTKALTLAANASGNFAGSINLATQVSGTLPVANGGTNLTSGFINGVTSVNLASGVTGTLPVANGGTALTSGFVNGSDAKISQMSQFRLDASVNNDQDPFTNWEEADDATYTRIGTAPTIASGVFTLPATGKYLILWDVAANSYGSNSGGADASVGWEIYATANNGTAWDRIARNTENFAWGGYYGNTNVQAHFNCTDTSTHKLKFTVSGTNNIVRTNGGTDTSYGGLSIIRIGD